MIYDLGAQCVNEDDERRRGGGILGPGSRRESEAEEQNKIWIIIVDTYLCSEISPFSPPAQIEIVEEGFWHLGHNRTRPSPIYIIICLVHERFCTEE